MVSIWRDDKRLTETLRIPAGYHAYRLPIMPRVNADSVLEGIQFATPRVEYCEVRRPAVSHVCDQHAVFLEWA